MKKPPPQEDFQTAVAEKWVRESSPIVTGRQAYGGKPRAIGNEAGRVPHQFHAKRSPHFFIQVRTFICTNRGNPS